MKKLGIILIIIGVAVMVLGIQQTTAIHNYNAALSSHDNIKNDTFAILTGLFGGAVVIAGWIVAIKKKR